MDQVQAVQANWFPEFHSIHNIWVYLYVHLIYMLPQSPPILHFQVCPKIYFQFLHHDVLYPFRGYMPMLQANPALS
ncbi:hypothetical protein [Gallid alphaherpesvirus 2]|nr:hypothetical protein [Gallid alphaherpesvirus 2]